MIVYAMVFEILSQGQRERALWGLGGLIGLIRIRKGEEGTEALAKKEGNYKVEGGGK